MRLAQPKTRNTLVFSHENAFNMGWRLDMMHNLSITLNCNIIAYDYRGYGESTGNPSEWGIKKDVEAL